MINPGNAAQSFNELDRVLRIEELYGLLTRHGFNFLLCQFLGHLITISLVDEFDRLLLTKMGISHRHNVQGCQDGFNLVRMELHRSKSSRVLFEASVLEAGMQAR